MSLCLFLYFYDRFTAVYYTVVEFTCYIFNPDKPSFSRVGVHYFGQFEVKVNRSRVKRYGVIFTYLSKIHLKFAASLDTDSYINALRRFIARRGQVKRIRSDNWTNFIGAEHELTRSIQEWNNLKFSQRCYRNTLMCVNTRLFF